MADQDQVTRQSQLLESVHDYLLYPVTRQSDVDVIFTYLRIFFSDLLRGDFTNEAMIDLEVVVDKFLHVVKRYGAIAPEDIEIAKKLAETIVEETIGSLNVDTGHNPPPRLSIYGFLSFTLSGRSRLDPTRIALFQRSTQLQTKLVAMYNSFTAQRDSEQHHLDMYDFYLPDLADKQRAAVLIEDAINLIDQDDTLSRRARTRILAHLRRAMGEMQKPRTDWSVYFGHVKEAIIVLGAIGSIVGGQCALLNAKDKLEEATRVIEQTSINLTYLSLTYNELTSQTVPLALPSGSQAGPASLTAPAMLPSRTGKNTEEVQQGPASDTDKAVEDDGVIGAHEG